MTTPPPRFSVVLPTRDRPEWLTAALESVLLQSFQDFEVLIVDDGSRQPASTVVEGIAAPRPIRVLRNERPRGAAAARNRGIEAARGAYVAFLDDDCGWHPERLARVDAVLRSRDPSPAYVATQTVLLSAGPPPRFTVDPVLPEGEPPWRVGAPMMVARRDVLLEVGGFDETLPRSHDWDLAIRLVDRAGGTLLAEPLVWAEDLPGLTTDPVKLRDASRILLAKYGTDAPVSRSLSVQLHRAFAHKLLIRHHGPEGRRHYRRAAALAPSMITNWVTLALAHTGTRLYGFATDVIEHVRSGRNA